jgi:transposase-like protein
VCPPRCRREGHGALERARCSEATLYLWKRQALIDAGRADGIKSFEADELAQALKTIAELETELEITRAAVALGARSRCRWVVSSSLLVSDVG